MRLGAEPVLQGLLETFDFPLGRRMVGLFVLLLSPANRVVNTSPLPVSVEAGAPCAVRERT